MSIESLSRQTLAVKAVIRKSFESLPNELPLRATSFSDSELTFFALATLTTAFLRTHMGSDHRDLLDGCARSVLQALVRDSGQRYPFGTAANEYQAAYLDYARSFQNVFVVDTQEQAMHSLSKSFLSRVARVRFDSPQANYLLVIVTSRILAIVLEETLSLVDDKV